jgi:general L-amino acid transport system substrate-binding protein
MKTNILKFFGSLALLLAFVISSVTANAGTKDNVIKKGSLNCGVSQGVPGFSNADASGKWSGIDVDWCRAVAAAVLGDANKVKYQPVSAKDRFEVLKSGQIDVLARNTTWTLSRDAGLALEFVGTNFYDGKVLSLEKLPKLIQQKNLTTSKFAWKQELQLS